MRPTLINGNALVKVKELEDNSIQSVVTSPPYWGLRDYGDIEQFGCEPTVEDYAANLVALFDEIKPKLKEDGTIWINIGDSYSGFSGNLGGASGSDQNGKRNAGVVKRGANLKKRDLVGVPWVAAFALREAGWYLRCDIIWHKPNPIPESVTNRPTRAHEFIFLLSKSEKYFYDMDAIREPLVAPPPNQFNSKGGRVIVGDVSKGKNARDVWSIPTASIRNSHIAVFPEEIPEKCILASTKPGDIVLDPFSGSGTTCRVASRLNRNSIGIELSEKFHNLAVKITLNDSKSLEDYGKKE